MSDTDLLDLATIRRAISDPGAVLPRDRGTGDQPAESVPNWSARAVQVVVGPKLEELQAEAEQLRAFRAEMERLATEWMTNADRIVLDVTDERDPQQAGVADALSTCSMVVRGLLAEHGPASPAQNAGLLREHLAAAARQIRKKAGDDAAGQVHRSLADEMSRLLDGPDEGLRDRVVKKVGALRFQLRWIEDSTTPEEVAQTTAFRQDIALLDKALRATRKD